MEALRAFYAQWGAIFILVKGLTPIPFKLVTIVSGLMDYNFPLFIASVADHARRAILHPGGGDQPLSAIRFASRLESHFGLFVGALAGVVVAASSSPRRCYEARRAG